MFSLFLAELHTTSESFHAVEAVAERLYEANVFNFVLVLVFLFWIFKKINLLSGIDSKTDVIKQRIINAEENKNRSENEYEVTRKNVEDVGNEVKNIENNAAEISSSLAKSIINEAHVEATYIEKNSERIIEGEKETTAILLSNNLTKAAFDIAEEHIKQAIDDRLHKKYIDEFIENLNNVKV